MKVKEVHYEITNKCNAGCPQCVRTNPETCQPWDYISKDECSLEDFKLFSPEEFMKDLNFIYFCGNYGDPVIAKDLLEILKYCYECNPKISIKVHSNCSIRSLDWWEKLALSTRDKKFVLVASIDGITQETQSMYRVGTFLDKIFENVGIFIENGGKAEWRFIIFKHNEHEVKLAEQLAMEKGFINFKSYSSNRFYSRPDFEYQYKGNKYILEPSSTEIKKFTDKKLIEFKNLNKVMDSEIKIDCVANKTNSIFIDFEGNILPCCHYGIRLYTFKKGVRDVNGDQYVYEVLSKFGVDRFNAKKNGFWSALDGCFNFLKELEKEWENSKPLVCKMICGRQQ